jgi:hypothetical protein
MCQRKITLWYNISSLNFSVTHTFALIDGMLHSERVNEGNRTPTTVPNYSVKFGWDKCVDTDLYVTL